MHQSTLDTNLQGVTVPLLITCQMLTGPKLHGLPTITKTKYYYYYYYYYHFTALQVLSGTIWVSRYQKSKTNLDLLEQEIVSGSGIS